MSRSMRSKAVLIVCRIPRQNILPQSTPQIPIRSIPLPNPNSPFRFPALRSAIALLKSSLLGGGVPPGALSTTQPDSGTVLGGNQTARSTGVHPGSSRTLETQWESQESRATRTKDFTRIPCSTTPQCDLSSWHSLGNPIAIPTATP